MDYWIAYTIILILGITLGVGMIVFVHRYWKNSPAVSKLTQNITLSLLTVFLILMVAEVFLKLFFAQSDGWSGYTLSSQNWFERYWVTNSMGYRDVEWSEEDLRSKRKILVVGDSFAAGQGIENVEDRFSNVLGNKLGNDYLAMNIATFGVSTKEEIDRLRGFPYKPEILILQYFINDIRYAANERNASPPELNIEPWPIFKPLVRNSHVVNFIYWRSVRLIGPHFFQMNNLAWLKEVYNRPDIWWLHQQELLTIYEGAASERVKLIVVVFPSMVDVEQSRELTAKVVDFFEERQVPVLDVTDLIENVPPKQLVANSLDAHPSEWVHQQVADALYEMVIELESHNGGRFKRRLYQMIRAWEDTRGENVEVQ